MGDVRYGTACPKPHRLVVKDKRTKMDFLIAPDSDVSFYPKSKTPSNRKGVGPSELYLNNSGSTIQTHGTLNVNVDIGLGQEFSWTFTLANFERPIIGRDFLKHFGLVLNFSKMCLFNPVTKCETDDMTTVICECHQNKYSDDGWPSVTGIFNQPIKQRFYIYDKSTKLPFLLGYTSQISIFPLSEIKPENKIEPFNGAFEVVDETEKNSEIIGLTTLMIDFGTGRKFVWKFAVVDSYKPIIGLDFMNNFSLVRKFKKGRFCLFDLHTSMSNPCDCTIAQPGWPSVVTVRAKIPNSENLSKNAPTEIVEINEFFNNNYKTSNFNPTSSNPTSSQIPESKESKSPRFKKGKKGFAKGNKSRTEEQEVKANTSNSEKLEKKHRFHVTDVNSKLHCLVSKAVKISMYPKNCVDEKNFQPSNQSTKIRGSYGQLLKVFGWTTQTLDFGLGRDYTFKFTVVDIEKPVIGSDFIDHFKFYSNPDSLIDTQTHMITAPPAEPCDCGKFVPGWPDLSFSKPRYSSQRGKRFNNYKRFPRRQNSEAVTLSETRMRSSTPVDAETSGNSRPLSADVSAESLVKSDSSKILNKSVDDSEAELETNVSKETRILELIISEENPREVADEEIDDVVIEKVESGNTIDQQLKEENENIQEQAALEIPQISEIENLESKEVKSVNIEKMDTSEDDLEMINEDQKILKSANDENSEDSKNEIVSQVKEDEGNVDSKETSICELKIEDITNFNESSTKLIKIDNVKKQMENLDNESNKLEKSDDLKEENQELKLNASDNSIKTSEEDFKECTEDLDDSNKMKEDNLESKENKELDKSDNSIKTSEEDFKECVEEFDETSISKLKIDSKNEQEVEIKITKDVIDLKKISKELEKEILTKEEIEDDSSQDESTESDSDVETEKIEISEEDSEIKETKECLEEEVKESSDSTSECSDSQKLTIDLESSAKTNMDFLKKYFHVMDKNNKILFFVNEKSEVSTFPRSLIHGDTMKDPEKIEYIVADSSLFPILGWMKMKLDFGLDNEYEWTFAVTDFVKPIIAQDFLNHFGLECDYTLEYSRLSDSKTLKKSEELLDIGDSKNSIDFPILTNFQKCSIQLTPKGKKIEVEICKSCDDCLEDERFIIVDKESEMPCLITEFDVSVYPKSHVEESDIEQFDDSFEMINKDGEVIPIYGVISRKIDFGLGRFFLWKFIVIDVDWPIISNDFLEHYGFITCMKEKMIYDQATDKHVNAEEFCKCQTNKQWLDDLKMRKVEESSTDEADSEEELEETEI